MDEVDSIEETYQISAKVRPFDPDFDTPFLYSTWRNSAYYGIDKKDREEPKEAFRLLTQEIKKILKFAKVRVACADNNPTHIMGYVVFTGNHLDWIYIKEDYRRMGIATLICPKNIKTFTDKPTKLGRSILEKKMKENDHAATEKG